MKVENTIVTFVKKKTFNRIENLKVHLRTDHKNIKSYKCDICDKHFSQKKIHINSIHKGLKHKCQHCNKEFYREEILKSRDFDQLRMTSRPFFIPAEAVSRPLIIVIQKEAI